MRQNRTGEEESRTAMKQFLHKAVRFVPATLIATRFLLGPVLLWVALDCKGQHGMLYACPWFIVGFTVAFMSDVFDGIIARRLGSVTEALREYDGWVDTWFYCWIAISAWLTHTATILTFRLPLLLVLSTQLLAWIIDWIKYRRFSNYHAYSSKAWGVTLFVACIALFGFDYAGITLWFTIIIGIISHMEEIAMTLTLPHWTYDVPSIVHALRIRQQEI
jgi:CDP-diacylglycerol--glycerol-3-phosphate 3-phosphatidyltransferase